VQKGQRQPEERSELLDASLQLQDLLSKFRLRHVAAIQTDHDRRRRVEPPTRRRPRNPEIGGNGQVPGALDKIPEPMVIALLRARRGHHEEDHRSSAHILAATPQGGCGTSLGVTTARATKCKMSAGTARRNVCPPRGGKQDVRVEENAVGVQREFGARCGIESGSMPSSFTAARASRYSAAVTALFRRNSAFRAEEYRSARATRADEDFLEPRLAAFRRDLDLDVVSAMCESPQVSPLAERQSNRPAAHAVHERPVSVSHSHRQRASMSISAPRTSQCRKLSSTVSHLLNHSFIAPCRLANLQYRTSTG
jgi:hypothetical protein